MNSIQENILELMASKNELFVRCAVDYREREDFRTPPVVKIEIYAMPYDVESQVVALIYEASHRDHLLRAAPGRIGPLDIVEFGSAWLALNYARREWVGDGLLGPFWQDSPAVACELKTPGDIPAATPMIGWLLVAHLMRLQAALQFEIARRSFREFAYGDGEKGVESLMPLDNRIGGLIDSLVKKRLNLAS